MLRSLHTPSIISIIRPRRLKTDCLVLLILNLLACSARKAPKVYVAIGDSYAAGFGAGVPLKPKSKDSCWKHSLSYPRQFYYADTDDMPEQFYDFSCGDAPAGNILKQIGQIPEDADLISFTWGAEYIKIPGVVYFCDEHFDSAYCNFVLGDVARRASANNIDAYDHVLPRLVQQVLSKAPNAMVVLLGYPRFLGSPVRNCVIHKGSPGSYYQAYKDRLNLLAPMLNLAMYNVASTNELRVQFKSPDFDFNFHRYCDSDPWYVPWQPWRKTYDGWSGFGYFHPTAQGQQVYKNLLRDAWNFEKTENKTS